MQIDRRTALSGLVAASSLALTGVAVTTTALAQPPLVEPEEETIPLPKFPESLAALNGLPERAVDGSGMQQFGSVKPAQIHFDVAKRIMELAPYKCEPIRVAKYFRDIRDGKLPDLGSDRLNNANGAHFACGWPYYYNPIIVEFFRAAGLNPLGPGQNGDATHWCAAFVNWCIARGQAPTAEVRQYSTQELKRGTRSASSGSFRCWQTATEQPKHGDIIVFARRGSVTGNCPNLAQGHVGFFDAFATDGRIYVIGGNQGNPSTVEGARNSAISTRRFRKSYTTVRTNTDGSTSTLYQDLHSYRTASFLQG